MRKLLVGPKTISSAMQPARSVPIGGTFCFTDLPFSARFAFCAVLTFARPSARIFLPFRVQRAYSAGRKLTLQWRSVPDKQGSQLLKSADHRIDDSDDRVYLHVADYSHMELMKRHEWSET